MIHSTHIYLSQQQQLISLFLLQQQLAVGLMCAAALICGSAALHRLTCEDCDLQEVERLANLFLDKLSAASAARHPRLNTIVKFAQLKSEFLGILGFSHEEEQPKHQQQQQQQQHQHQQQQRCGGAAAGEDYASEYSFDRVTNDLDALVGQSRAALLSRASSILSHSSADAALAARTAEIARLYFTADERRAVARLLIRSRDYSHRYHCDQPDCIRTGQCPFRVVMCSNEGCGVMFSLNALQQHDGRCPEKPISCLRHCGVAPVKRRNLQHHLWHECTLRPVTCPFEEFGCTVELLEKDLAEHVAAQQSQHLHLALLRMKEYQSVIKSLNQRVHELESHSAAQAAALSSLEASVQAGATALKLSEARSEKTAKDLLYRLEQKVNRNTSALSTTNGELSRLQRQITSTHPSK